MRRTVEYRCGLCAKAVLYKITNDPVNEGRCECLAAYPTVPLKSWVALATHCPKGVVMVVEEEAWPQNWDSLFVVGDRVMDMGNSRTGFILSRFFRPNDICWKYHLDYGDEIYEDQLCLVCPRGCVFADKEEWV